MKTNDDIRAMANQLMTDGFNSAQQERYDFAFWAATNAAGFLLCARYGATAEEVIEALKHSKNINAEKNSLVARIEMAPEFVRFVHSNIEF